MPAEKFEASLSDSDTQVALQQFWLRLKILTGSLEHDSSFDENDVHAISPLSVAEVGGNVIGLVMDRGRLVHRPTREELLRDEATLRRFLAV